MKKTKFIFALSFFILIVSSINGQSLNSLFAKYGKHADFELISVNKPMLTIARTMADKESKKILSKLSGLNVLTSKNTNLQNSLMNELNALIERDNFESIVEVREKGERVNIYFNTSKKNSDALIVVNDGELNLIWLTGNFTLNDLQNLNKKK